MARDRAAGARTPSLGQRAPQHLHLGLNLDARRPQHDDAFRLTTEQARRAGQVVAGMAAHGVSQRVAPGNRAIRAWARIERSRWAHPSVRDQRDRALLHLHVRDDRDLMRFAESLRDPTTPFVLHLHETVGHGVLGTTTARRHRAVDDAGSRLLARAALVVVPDPSRVAAARQLGSRHVVAVPGAAMPVAHGLPLRPARPAPWLWGRRIVAVGPLTQQRVRPLVEALPAMPADTDLILLGDGPDEHQIAAVADGLVVGHRVHVHHQPTWEAVDAHLWHADVVATVSRRDDDVNVLLRAMALGRPVTAVATGGRRHLVSTGVDGILVPPRDRWSLAGALHRLLTDPPMAAELGAAGARRVAARTWRDVGADILGAIADPQGRSVAQE